MAKIGGSTYKPMSESERKRNEAYEKARKEDEARKAYRPPATVEPESKKPVEKPAPTPARSTVDQIRYRNAETAWNEAVASGDPTAENKEFWIRNRMHGMR